MYLTPTEKHWVLDAETESLDPKIVWLVCVRNAITKEELSFTDYAKLSEWIAERLREGCYFVTHNGIKFDAPVLNRLVGTRIPVSRVVDCFVLSMLYSPSLRGGHSLRAWGERVGLEKLPHKDFTAYTPELERYCIRDVRITDLVFERLTKRMRDVGFAERGCEIEHLAWRIIDTQKRNGFHFDQARAHQYLAEIRGIEDELRERIYHKFPPELQCVAEYKKAYKRDGSHSALFEQHLATFPEIRVRDDGSYEAYDYVEFNLGSPIQRVTKLLELGWEPREFTEKGNPRPTYKGDLSPSLLEFVEKENIEEVRLIAEWMAMNARGTSINNWLDFYNEQTGCIHGNLWLANTLRYRHSDPNTANIPRIRMAKVAGKKVPARGRAGFYTYEARDLWGTRDRTNRSLVGVDATGIQFRVLAHYLNDEEFTKIVLGGDIHEYNRSKTGVGDRDQNKTFGYAALLGAGAAKTGSIFGVSPEEGGQIKRKWIATVPGLRELYDRLENELERTGRITLCDGSRVLVPSPHMVLAYLLQGDESRIMKQAMIYTDQLIRKEGLDVLKVGDIHDEWQNDVLGTDVEPFRELCTQCFAAAGRSFDYNLPIECDSKVGKTWAETH